jgi:hypothetical protein
VRFHGTNKAHRAGACFPAAVAVHRLRRYLPRMRPAIDRKISLRSVASHQGAPVIDLHEDPLRERASRIEGADRKLAKYLSTRGHKIRPSTIRQWRVGTRTWKYRRALLAKIWEWLESLKTVNPDEDTFRRRCRAYCKAHPGSSKDLASVLGMARQTLRNWWNGQKPLAVSKLTMVVRWLENRGG